MQNHRQAHATNTISTRHAQLLCAPVSAAASCPRPLAELHQAVQHQIWHLEMNKAATATCSRRQPTLPSSHSCCCCLRWLLAGCGANSWRSGVCFWFTWIVHTRYTARCHDTSNTLAATAPCGSSAWKRTHSRNTSWFRSLGSRNVHREKEKGLDTATERDLAQGRCMNPNPSDKIVRQPA